MEQEEGKIKDLITREQLLKKSGNIGQVEAETVTLGDNIGFDYDDESGISMRIGPKMVGLTPDSLRHILREIGMPMNYFANTPTGLVIPHLNHYYKDAMDGRKIRLLKQKDKITAVSFSPRDEFISLSRLIDTIEREINKDDIAGYHNPYFGWDSTNINVVLTRNFSVVQEDLLNVGIRFVHSFNELNPTRATAYVFRQWCSNGAVTMDRIKCWSRRSKAESFRKWISSVVVGAKDACNKEENRLRRLTEIPTNENTADILDHLLAEGNIPLVVREAVRSEAIDQETKSLYDVYNVITRVTTHSNAFDEHPSALEPLEMVAGELSFHSELCPTCHHKIA